MINPNRSFRCNSGSDSVVNLGDAMTILDLGRQGLSVSEIARQTGRDRKTIAKYIKRGLEPPAYSPRPPCETLLGPFEAYLRERVAAYPGLSGARLLREIKDNGYTGGYTLVTDFLREVRPRPAAPFEVRFETPPGLQAQVDFARFTTPFTDEPERHRIVWLFSLVLGHSRWIWARFVENQTLETVLRCHIAAFEVMGGTAREILYDRMKSAVIGPDRSAGAEGHIVYNRALVDLARHYGFHPKACRPYRAKTKGKVERPFRYIREDFFLGRTFRNLGDLNVQLLTWLNTVANVRRHATTERIVVEHFAEEKPALVPLPLVPFRSVLKLERRVSHEGMVSVGGNLYSVPDTTRKRVVEVHTLAAEIQIFEDGRLIANHPILDGRNRRRIAPGHRKVQLRRNAADPPRIDDKGGGVARRPLDIYAAIGRRLAAGGNA